MEFEKYDEYTDDVTDFNSLLQDKKAGKKARKLLIEARVIATGSKVWKGADNRQRKSMVQRIAMSMYYDNWQPSSGELTPETMTFLRRKYRKI